MLYYIWNKTPRFIAPYLSVIFYIHKFIFIIFCNLEISIRTQEVLNCETQLGTPCISHEYIRCLFINRHAILILFSFWKEQM